MMSTNIFLKSSLFLIVRYAQPIQIYNLYCRLLFSSLKKYRGDESFKTTPIAQVKIRPPP
jgi:hypothetical protein